MKKRNKYDSDTARSMTMTFRPFVSAPIPIQHWPKWYCTLTKETIVTKVRHVNNKLCNGDCLEGREERKRTLNELDAIKKIFPKLKKEACFLEASMWYSMIERASLKLQTYRG